MVKDHVFRFCLGSHHYQIGWLLDWQRQMVSINYPDLVGKPESLNHSSREFYPVWLLLNSDPLEPVFLAEDD